MHRGLQTAGWRLCVQQIVDATQNVHGMPSALLAVSAPVLQDVPDQVDVGVAENAAASLTSYSAQFAGIEAIAMARLLQWVTSAETLVSEIRHHALGDPGFSPVLGNKGLRINSPAWSEHIVDQGLYDVMNRQIELIKQVTGVEA